VFLLTLPALENVSFEQLDHGEGPIEEGQSLESMVKLYNHQLYESQIRQGHFHKTFSQAVAEALKKGLKSQIVLCPTSSL
jgi:hypothetical protein